MLEVIANLRNAAYFVSICTANRECYFGNIMDGKMELTEIGKLAKKYWQEIPWHFPFVKLDEFIIMPNHIHGIIIINKTDDYKNDKSIKGSNVGRKVQTTKLVVSTQQAPRTAAASQNWKPATLGAIINQYKRICTIESRKINPNFNWQPDTMTTLSVIARYTNESGIILSIIQKIGIEIH